MKNQAPKTGSVLLVTLLVVSLLMIVVLTLTTSVRMELRKASSVLDGMQARNNARLGAELAVARLQETLGPDTRVSASADLFRSGAGNVYQPGLNRHTMTRNWVGVWDSQDFDDQDAQSKGFIAWLVSNPVQAPLENVNVINQDPTTVDSVFLVGPGTVSRMEDAIEVPTVPMQGLTPGTNLGQYAFWVRDEGTKARFNLQDPYRGTTDDTVRQYSMRAAQRHAAELFSYDLAGTRLSTSGWYPLENDPNSETFAERRERMVGTPHMSFLGWSPASQDAFESLRELRYHDFSLVSRGLMTNTARGGLRTDLSLAFEMPIADFLAHEIFGSASPNAELPAQPRPAGFPAGERITPVFAITDFTPFGFTPENSPNSQSPNPVNNIAPVLRGPSWNIIRNFHRMYKLSDPDRDRYGLDTNQFRNIAGRQVAQGRGLYPMPEGLTWTRRYAQDASAWTYARIYGPRNSTQTLPRPIERPIMPGLSPIVTRVQVTFSVRTEPMPESTDSDGNIIREHRVDLFMEPMVTLWNPYNVPLATGSAYGQPLQLSLRFLNLRMQLEVRDIDGTTRVEVLLADLFVDESGDSTYDKDRHESFQLTLQGPGGGGLVMEPGEVVFFSGVDSEVTYERSSAAMTNMDESGVNLTLRPGITSFLPLTSGIRFEDPWGTPVASDADLKVRTRNINLQKFQVAGVNRVLGSSSPPFFGTFDASNIAMATGYSEPFPPTQYEGVKRPFFIYDVFLKNESSARPVNLMSQFNLRAATFEQGHFTNAESSWYIPSLRIGDLWAGQVVRVNGGWNNLYDTHGTNSRGSYWGSSNNSSTLDDNRFVIMFEIPRLPPMSLGTLQHAPTNFMVDEPSFAVGNSLAPVMVRHDQKISLQNLNNRPGHPSTFPNNLIVWNEAFSPRSRGQWTMTRPDWSYLLNEALWDSFFYSSLSPDPVTGVGARDRFDAFLNGGDLPNTTFRPLVNSGEALESIRDRLFSGSEISHNAPETVAANLMQAGTFNVNSTSVEAWRAVLSSTRNLTMDVQDQSTPVVLDGTAFTRTALPANNENDRWRGFRNLTDVQIDALAEEIVREVRVRGPFLSLSDFVNRRLHPANHATQRSGALQSAIGAVPSLNSSFTRRLQDGGLVEDDLNKHVKTRVVRDSRIAESAPGYLLQSDLLTLIGPMLSARSDTFTVRAFGEFADAKAWCEITVQRVPEFVDSEDDPWTSIADVSDVNQTFGRRFEITSFRWLNEEDI